MNITEIMLSAIRAQVCGDESVQWDVLSEDEMRSLYALSKMHDMAHLVSVELERRNLLTQGEEISQKFIKQTVAGLFRYEQINHAFEALCAALEEAHIPFIPLKGAVMRRYYPEPWMRSSCDIDILIKNEDLDAAVAYTKDKLNYRLHGRTTHDVSLLSANGVHVELHYDLLEVDYANRCYVLLKNVWNYARLAEGCAYRYELTDEMFYFYHVVHMAKHFRNGGCGIRPFLDLWLLDHRVEHDAAKRDAVLAEGEILTFAKSARELAEVWFGNAAHTALTLQMQQYLLRGGAYGNMENHVAARQRREGGKFKYILSRLFLPYDKIKLLYPILQKHRFLTPIMEVRRWFKLCFGGTWKRSVKEIDIYTATSREQCDNVTELLMQVGLQ